MCQVSSPRHKPHYDDDSDDVSLDESHLEAPNPFSWGGAAIQNDMTSDGEVEHGVLGGLNDDGSLDL